jgi:hypothetical protein
VKLAIILILGAALMLGLACEGPMFSSADESDIRIAIAEAERDGLLSRDKAAGLLSILDDVQTGYGWEA